VAYFEVVSSNLPGEAKEQHKNSVSVSGLRAEILATHVFSEHGQVRNPANTKQLQAIVLEFRVYISIIIIIIIISRVFPVISPLEPMVNPTTQASSF
jgi:hypothetical protein